VAGVPRVLLVALLVGGCAPMSRAPAAPAPVPVAIAAAAPAPEGTLWAEMPDRDGAAYGDLAATRGDLPDDRNGDGVASAADACREPPADRLAGCWIGR
jgi:hypothetical protein